MADHHDAGTLAHSRGATRAGLLLADGLALAGGLAPVVAALALWWLGLSFVDLGRMNDLGLISVLPPPVFAAIALLVLSFCIELGSKSIDRPVLAIHLVALVFVLYAIPPFVEDVPRTQTVWTHLGFVEYIARTGTTAPGLDARMNWPGFFVGSAFLSSVAGPGVVAAIAHWASVIFNLLYLLPVAVIAQALTGSRRLVWGSVLVFVLTNWIGQDLFSPQAFTYFLYLVIVAVIVTWFLAKRPRSDAVVDELRRLGRPGTLLDRVYSLFTPDNPPSRTLSGGRQAAVISVILMLFASISFSHQLMPFVTTGALVALLVMNRISLRSIPILFGVIAVTWVSYMTVPFLSGHVGALIREFGSVGQTITNSVTGRIAGSEEHQVVVLVRVVFTLAIWGLAGVGALLRYRNGKRDLTTIILAGAPFALIALQGYGGEIVLRLYLFSLPFVAILVAGIVYGRREGPPRVWASGLVVVVACVISFGFLVARYGNERIDLMTRSEVDAVEVLYQTAPSGSLLVAPVFNLPWRFEKVEQYTYLSADTITVADLEEVMRDPRFEHSFLILTKSQGAWLELFDGYPQGSWDGFVAEVNSSSAFTEIYRNQDSQILVLLDRAIPSTVR